MKLATVESVLNRANMGGVGLAGQSHVFDSALEAATEHLATWLRTELAKAEVIDHFQCNVVRWEKVTLWCSRKFITSPEVSLYISSSRITDLLPSQKVDSSIVSFDWQTGEVNVGSSFSAPQVVYISASYTAGFTSEEDPNIPAWLSNAAIETALAVHRVQSVRHSKKDSNLDEGQMIWSMARHTIARRLFTPLVGYQPLPGSQVTELV